MSAIDDLERFREALLRRRTELLEQGDIKLDPNRRDANVHPDEDEQPLNEMNQVIASRRNRQRAQELQGIEAALRRMETEPDEFGICQDCEEPIAPRRLELMPWTRFCVECQAKQSGTPRSGSRRHLTDYIE